MSNILRFILVITVGGLCIGLIGILVSEVISPEMGKEVRIYILPIFVIYALSYLKKHNSAKPAS